MRYRQAALDERPFIGEKRDLPFSFAELSRGIREIIAGLQTGSDRKYWKGEMD
jgi:hypothetical protein